MSNVKLTSYSHGAGCGCKISPAVLSSILHGSIENFKDERLLVGYENRDDAAVLNIGNGMAIISTTDFFMPIVDDPFTFGRIAAANAISDVYAMGGKPLVAIAILGWPVNILSPEIAKLVLDGGRDTCTRAGIALAGGHSIDSPEPIFGLAVTGQIEIGRIRRNDTSKVGNILYLTKPLGIGILTTAMKQGKLKEEHEHLATDTMLQLNSVGSELAGIHGVTAMTDVTGFGLLGHLAEMCNGSGLSAEINSLKIPRFDVADMYIKLGCIPGGTCRNWDSYGESIHLKDQNMMPLLCDPQTSGGLLIAVEKSASQEVEKILQAHHISAVSFGLFTKRKDTLIDVL